MPAPDLHVLLKQYWGYDAFRPLQEDIIRSVLEGRDVLALLPTGGGKSICYQVPALAAPGICLVISPLIALMKDQVANLHRRGIHALLIHSGMSFPEVRRTLENARHGNYKLLYVSPERLESALFLEYLPALRISLVAVDEAHCISQWGFDFRPAYRRIAALREQLPGVPVLALTASATRVVQDDICTQLCFSAESRRFQQSFDRPNLSYSAFEVPSKQHKLIDILRKVPGSAIVYCKSRRHTREVAGYLQQQGIRASYYHAGLGADERSSRQDDWVQNRIRVMVCTNAFGMGIDKPDVRVVVHYDVPDCLEHYYQEAGRAGRDGHRAYAVLLYNRHELADLEAQVALRYPSREEIRKVYTALMNFLQVPAGYGEGQRYPFDTGLFARNFKIPVLTVAYVLQLLEQEGLLLLSEGWQQSSTVMITCGRHELEEAEHTHPQLDEVLKALLRSCEGILEFPARIRESELARFAGLSRETLVQRLEQLERLGFLHYEAQAETPVLLLLRNRMYNDSILLRLEHYEERREQYAARVTAMKNYALSSDTCRSRQLAGYFAAEVKDCGICDHCLSRRQTAVSRQDFEQLAAEIRSLAVGGELKLSDWLARFSTQQRERYLEVIDFLQDEGSIALDEHGKLTAAAVRRGKA